LDALITRCLHDAPTTATELSGAASVIAPLPLLDLAERAGELCRLAELALQVTTASASSGSPSSAYTLLLRSFDLDWYALWQARFEGAGEGHLGGGQASAELGVHSPMLLTALWRLVPLMTAAQQANTISKLCEM
jgi:hypothetical protein